ncbi:Panacea domain-containing protein [Veillonella sp. R32]|uniref:Panacea domain-containing protein n=1 Tax=Veillonella sp. R32 TaxID=2021312 RepID=UPI00138A2865|nr:type II toxin-antitoxin system antitoxin SocA domain-containing protein [Veillonella sp. R32]KAF1682399.1 hypothetical protein VER_05830 [Veillonella sp. R32]
MAKAIDVAKFFIELVNNNPNEDLMTNLRLNKLLYFAQAASFKKLGYPLIEESFEAWQFGPVLPEVYETYKHFGRNGIQSEPFDRSKLNRKEQLFLIDVLRTYNAISTSALVKMSHESDGPWSKSYKFNKHEIIANEAIKSYFKDKNIVEDFKPVFAKSQFIGHRDTIDDVLILPKDMDYAE